MLDLSSKMQGLIYVVFCVLLWAMIPVFAKFGQVELNHYQYLFYSSFISFLTLLFISLYTRKFRDFFSYSFKTFIQLFILGFLNFMYYLLLYFGFKEANGLEVLVIQYTWPIFVVILSIIFLNEKITKNKILSVLLGFIGVIIIITKGDLLDIDFTNLKVILIVLLGSISVASFSVFSKRMNINPINAVCIYFFSALIYSYISIVIFSSFTIPSLSSWVSVIINGIFINGISYIFWIKALQKADASFIAPFIFITPVLSIILLILIFKEPVLYVYLFGLVFIILSGVINLGIKFKKT